MKPVIQLINDITSRYFGLNFKKRKLDFVFLVHPRYTKDIHRKFKIFKFVPDFLVNLILLISPPTFGGSIRGLKNSKGAPIYGAIIIVPLTGRQMLRHRKYAKKKVISAVKLSVAYGAKIIGLGALTSSVTSGGVDIQKLFPDVAITSGNTLTSWTSFHDIDQMIMTGKVVGPISIIGATGSIGQAVTRMLALKYSEIPLYVVGKNNDKVAAIIDLIQKENEGRRKNLVGTTNMDDVASSDLLFVTTSAAGAVIHKDHTSSVKYIYDITQPKNTPKSIQVSDELTFIDGGLIKLPEGIEINLDIGIPKGTSFSCLAETMILCSEEIFTNTSGGEIDLDRVKIIGEIAQKKNFASYLIYAHSNKHSI